MSPLAFQIPFLVTIPMMLPKHTAAAALVAPAQASATAISVERILEHSAHPQPMEAPPGRWHAGSPGDPGGRSLRKSLKGGGRLRQGGRFGFV